LRVIVSFPYDSKSPVSKIDTFKETVSVNLQQSYSHSTPDSARRF
jgi:hypothetical protein